MSLLILVEAVFQSRRNSSIILTAYIVLVVGSLANGHITRAARVLHGKNQLAARGKCVGLVRTGGSWHWAVLSDAGLEPVVWVC